MENSILQKGLFPQWHKVCWVRAASSCRVFVEWLWFTLQSPTPPQYVFWYHNDRMINYDTSRGGITVETDPGPKTQSRLTIRDAQDTDSGNYTCSASNTEPASIYVFVSEGRLQLKSAALRTKLRYEERLSWSFFCPPPPPPFWISFLMNEFRILREIKAILEEVQFSLDLSLILSLTVNLITS